MHIARRFTTAGTRPVRRHRVPYRDERDPQPRRLGRLCRRGRRGPGGVEPGRLRYLGAEIPAQGRRAGGTEAGRGAGRPGMAVAPYRRRGQARAPAARTSAMAARPAPSNASTGSPAPGPIGAGRAAISTPRKTPARSSTSCALMLARQMGAPNSPQWFNTGLHWAYGIDGPAQGHYYVDHQHRQGQGLGQRLRAPAAACLLHPVGHRRSRQRGRDHGSVGARGAPVQIRLGHRLEFLETARRRRAACRAAAARRG